MVAWILVFLPLISMLLLVAFAFIWGKRAVILISTALSILHIVLSTIFCLKGLLNGIASLSCNQYVWVQLPDLIFTIGLKYDELSTCMLFVVSLISNCIILYSGWYMEYDPAIIKFQAILFFFTFSMCFMITADNFIQFFMGWECIGLASFLLISHWINRNDAVNGGLKAILYNRVGDASFLIALCYIYTTFKSFNFDEIFATNPDFDNISVIVVSIFLAAFVKSAQFIFHGWLFNAMEGPTPVSALLHSATMVTAGIYLLLRTYPFFEHNLFFSNSLIVFGISTSVLAAIGAYFQTDLKRIIAYSTCSQLGLMTIAIGASCYFATIFHLLTHAFFKAMLFFLAGILIHIRFKNQDIRQKMFQLTPELVLGLLVASSALAGFPGFSGFYSKDLILESLFDSGLTLSIPVFFLICFAAGFTAGYSIKSYAKSYFYNAGFSPSHLHASTYVFYSSKLFLVFLIFLVSSIGLGYAIHGFFEHDFFSLSLQSLNGNIVANDEVPYELYFFPFILASIGAIFSFFIHRDTVLSFPSSLYIKKYFSFFRRDYVLNEFFNYILTRPALVFAYNICYKTIDRGFLELFGPWGLRFLTTRVYFVSTGSIYYYIYLVCLTFGIGFFLLWILYY